jgi:hypothetical protein
MKDKLKSLGLSVTMVISNKKKDLKLRSFFLLDNN